MTKLTVNQVPSKFGYKLPIFVMHADYLSFQLHTVNYLCHFPHYPWNYDVLTGHLLFGQQNHWEAWRGNLEKKSSRTCTCVSIISFTKKLSVPIFQKFNLYLNVTGSIFIIGLLIDISRYIKMMKKHWKGSKTCFMMLPDSPLKMNIAVFITSSI